MEIDSKPEVMDKLDRRLIQLKIEREAVKKEKDESSKKRFALIETEITKLQREYADLEEIWKAEKGAAQGTAHLKEEMEKVRAEIVRLQREGKLEQVAELQYGKLPQLEAKLKEAVHVEENKPKNRLLRTQVGAEEIAEVVSRATGIPVSKMMQGERDKLLKMEDKLHERVVGQDEAVRLVSDAIRRSRSGLSDPNRPYGSFLFLGPTGVGKTELCKALAGFMFDSEDHLIRIDMSEYMEKHSVARLIGAPPGYVGYEEGGGLTEAVRRNPYSVIQLKYLETRLAAMEMKLAISDAALAEIANAGFDPVYGARPLKRAIQAQLENPLAKLILEGRFAAKDTIKVGCVGGVMKFEKA